MLPNDVRLIIYRLIHDALHTDVVQQYKTSFMIYWSDESNTFLCEGLWLILTFRTSRENTGVQTEDIFNVWRLIENRHLIRTWEARVKYAGTGKVNRCTR